LNGLDARLFDVVRSCEIRLTNTEIDDRPALGLEAGAQAENFADRRRLETAQC